MPDYTWLTLRALLEGELDEHPLMPEVRLYCSRRRWPKPAALIAAAGFLISCAHPAPVLPAEPPAVTIATLEPVAGSSDGPKPVKDQKAAPCEADLEMEAGGFCWLELAKRPPCPLNRAREWAGKCLVPVAKPAPIPRSLTP